MSGRRIQPDDTKTLLGVDQFAGGELFRLPIG
jgi:hypothetical protein